LVARDQSVTDIALHGIRLTERDEIVSARVKVGPAEELGKQDVVFLCPKAQDLPALARDIQPLLQNSTLIVPVVNGIPWWYFDGPGSTPWEDDIFSVDPTHVLKALLPTSSVIGCVTMFTAARTSRWEAVANNGVKLVIGEIDDILRPRTEALAATLNSCGIQTRVSDRIRDPLWTKVIANLMSNPLSVVAEAHLQDLCGTEPLSTVVRQLLNEALLVAASYGARLELDPDSLIQFGAGMGKVKTSMLQDYESGHPLELGAICEAVMELGMIRGIEMPLTRTITALARYKSEASLRQAA
jgi:2-dehydropantoate 2-reductase